MHAYLDCGMRTSSSWAGPLLVALSAALCGVTGCGSDDDDGNFELEGSGGQMQTGGGGAGAGSQSGGGGSGGSGAGSQSGGGGSGGSVVDPGATVLSYLGESSSVELVGDMGRDVAVDADGNFYVTGGLDRMNGAPFNGALGKSFGSRDDEDIFVVSFDPEGALRYATIIGGPNYDRAYAIEVDANGRAIVAGRAGNGFPTTAGVVQPTFADDNTPNGAYGKQDGVLFMLDETGDLTWATYLGSGGRDFIRDIDLGPDGSIFAAVAAAVGPYPYATSGSFVDTPPSGSNTVLVKINPAATAVSWGGYLGGSGDETSPPAIRVNAAGEAFVVWSSSANNVPITPGAYQTTLGGGSDLVVARVAADGGSLIYCTYVGGAGDELVETHQIAINSSNQVVVVTAVDTPLPGVNGLQQTIAGGRDMLLAKLSADGSSLVAATYLGGSADEHAEGIMIGSSGEVYVTGSTPSVDFPTTANALQGTKGAAGDGVVAILSADLSELVYSTFVGGDAGDQLRGVAIGPQLEILATGQTASSNLAVTPEAVQSTYGGGPTDVMYVRIPRPE